MLIKTQAKKLHKEITFYIEMSFHYFFLNIRVIIELTKQTGKFVSMDGYKCMDFCYSLMQKLVNRF